jgi:hypothetical protein
MDTPVDMRVQFGHHPSIPVRVGWAHITKPRFEGTQIVADVTLRVNRRNIAWAVARLGHPIVALRYLARVMP